jgi:hypothetical protein
MKYFLYEVVLPLFLVVLVYFAGGVLFRDEPHLFEKVFSTGDLLGMSVLILINGFVALDRAEWELGFQMFNVSKAGLFLSGALVFAGFLCIKVAALHFKFDDEPLDAYITISAWASFGCLAYSACMGGVARILTANAFKTAINRRASGTNPSSTLTHPSI